MAVSGNGTPGCRVKIERKQLAFHGYPQNKPARILKPLNEAVELLARGEGVTVDARWPFQKELRAELARRGLIE